MSSDRRAAYDRVLERRRAVALAEHYRYREGLSIAQIAGRLGRSPDIQQRRGSDSRLSGAAGWRCRNMSSPNSQRDHLAPSSVSAATRSTDIP